MSKYYKEEDLQRALIGFIRETGIDEKPYDYAVNVLDSLPTIEVSEDTAIRIVENECFRDDLSKEIKDYLFSDLRHKLYHEQAEVSEDCDRCIWNSCNYNKVPWEISEDAISREYLKSFEYINKGDFNSIETIREWIDNAPSVVPSRAEGEWKKEVNEKLGKCLRVTYVCSACGCAVGCEYFVRRSFYPNCGAKMRLE